MNILKSKINKEGIIIDNKILRVDMFLNHQLDIELLNEIGKEFKNRFKDKQINKILTVETSGIGIACVVAQYFNNVPVVFAKKHSGSNMGEDVYKSKVYSFTKDIEYTIKVSKDYINKEDKVLIIDDFLASGSAMSGLIEIAEKAGAIIEGVGIVIEKQFQKGREIILNKGIKLESLAIIKGFENNKVIFK